jgi:OPT family oligopeptide transporter
VNDHPIEEVRNTVPISDDPSEPCLTFRTWVLGMSSCVMLAFVNEFFNYRSSQLSIGTVVVQIASLPIGRLMASTLPERPIRVPLTGGRCSFSLNPGPFSLKEHCLITIFAGAGCSGVYALNIIAIVKVFYKRQINPYAAMLLAQTTQVK